MKKFVAICVSAVAIGLAGALVVGRLPRYETPAKSQAAWDTNAIKGTFAGVQVREIDAANSSLILLYDLQNETDHDYQLANGSNLVIMGRLKSDGTLIPEEQIKLSEPAFVPTRNRTRISLGVTRPFQWPTQMDAAGQSEVRNFVAREVAELDGFMLFDATSLYQIELPGSWQGVQEIPLPSAPR